MTVSLSNPRAKQRWTFLAGVVAAGTLIIAAMALGFTQANFELDKNANHDLTSTHLGSLQSSVNSTALTITVCYFKDALGNPQAVPVAPFEIQIDAERMNVTSINATAGGTGGCAFSDSSLVATASHVWTVSRHYDGTTAAAHVGTTPRNEITRIQPDQSGIGHDWDQVYSDFQNHTTNGVTDCSDIGAIACAWKNRPNSGTASSSNGFTGPTTFTGTSGDLNAISQWVWTNQSVPDADEINNAYAAKYAGPPQNIFVGMDRYAVNGSKDIGFWFFHEKVGPLDGGSFSGAHCYAGQTTDNCGAPAHGDLLILTTFSAGGSTTTARAYEWVGNGPGAATSSDGVLNFLGSFGDCVPGAASQHGCATTASSTVPAPWTGFVQEKPTGASPNVFYAGGFMEGGLDLSALGEEGCFSSFMGVSRSSPSLTAQPKAFIGGNFESCGSTLTTQPADSSGNALTDGIVDSTDPLPDISIGTGSVQVRDNATLTVTGTSSFTGSIAFHICGPLSSPTGTCATGGVSAGSVTANANGNYSSPLASAPTLTSVGRYCWRGDFTSTTTGVPAASDSSTSECFEVLPVTPTLVTSAWSNGDATGSAQTTPVDFGSPVYDKANLSGTASQPGTNGGSDPGQLDNTYPSINATNGAAAGASIAFTLTGPDTVGPPPVCSTTTAAQKTGTSGSNPETVTVTGNGDYFTSGFTPAAPGQYHWVAVYTPTVGDPNNIGSTYDADCSHSAENVTVSQIPTVTTTRQFVFPQDKVKIDTNPSGLTLAGNVTFRLFGATDGTNGTTVATALANCQADDGTATSQGLVYSPTSIAISGVGPQYATTNNTTFRIVDSATYYWRVLYHSTSEAQLDSKSDCAESTAVTYGGNDATIAIP